jgi:hypothetical protein
MARAGCAHCGARFGGESAVEDRDVHITSFHPGKAALKAAEVSSPARAAPKAANAAAGAGSRKTGTTS